MPNSIHMNCFCEYLVYLHGEQGYTYSLWKVEVSEGLWPCGEPPSVMSWSGLPWATAPIPTPPVLLWAGGREDQEPEKRGRMGEGILRFCFYFSFSLWFNWKWNKLIFSSSWICFVPVNNWGGISPSPYISLWTFCYINITAAQLRRRVVTAVGTWQWTPWSTHQNC